MVLDVVLSVIALIVLFIASFCDWKTREVPDWLNYGLIFAALGIRSIFSIKLGWNILLSGALGFLVFFLIAMLFYRLRQWGGGDSKLLMGMGAVIGISLPFDSSSLSLLWFFFSLLFLGSIYGLCWMFYVAIKEKKVFLKEFRSQLSGWKTQVGLGTLSLTFVSLGLVQTFLWYFAIFPIVFYYLFNFVTAVERSCFVKDVSIDKLTEGDWLVKDVIWDDKVVLKKKTLESDDLKKLYQLKAKVARVTIKEGIPFIPSFLLAYLMLLFGKDLFTWFLGILF